MKIQVLANLDWERLLENQDFVSQWTKLHSECAWSTVFQGVPFVTSWYRVYRPAFDPVVVIGWHRDGRMSGLLFLARDRKTGALTHAGEKHAEYQTWLATERSPAFISAALDAVRTELPSAALELRYVPADAPLSELLEVSPWASRIVTWNEDRGIADLGGSNALAALVDSNRYRYRLRKLSALGSVEFRTVTSREELDPWIDRLVTFCDLRQGAINGCFPFHEDPLKLPFHFAMFDHPELLHVTLLTAGQALISAQINFRDRKTIALGLISHSAEFGKLSPGTLHLLLLARLAQSEGYERLDLTPGGEYKDRFASHSEPTSVVRIEFSARRALRARARAIVARTAKAQLRSWGLQPARVRKTVEARLSTATDWLLRVPSAFGGSANADAPPTEFRVYTLRAGQNAATVAPSSGVRHNDAADLLLPSASRLPLSSRRSVLRAALTRFERGEQLVTRVCENRLTHTAWFTEGPAKIAFAETLEPYELGSSSALLYAFDRFGSDVAADVSFLSDSLAWVLSRAKGREVHVAIASSDLLCDVLQSQGATLAWESTRANVPSQAEQA